MLGLFAETRAQTMADAVMLAVQELQSILDEAKENVDGGLHLRLCNATQAVYTAAEALNGGGDGSDEEEEEGDDAEEVRMVYTPGGPYYECPDGSHVRVWNNPHMMAQLAAGGANNWRERRGVREGAHRGRHGAQRAGGAVGVEL